MFFISSAFGANKRVHYCCQQMIVWEWHYHRNVPEAIHKTKSQFTSESQSANKYLETFSSATNQNEFKKAIAFLSKRIDGATTQPPVQCRQACFQCRSPVGPEFFGRLSPKFHLARHVSIRHVRRVEPMHFDCVELVEQHGSTGDTLDTTSSTGWTRRTCRVVSRRDQPSGIWAYLHDPALELNSFRRQLEDICLQTNRHNVPSALEILWLCAIWIYLLTYLLNNNGCLA